jgi:hypothetical protein
MYNSWFIVCVLCRLAATGLLIHNKLNKKIEPPWSYCAVTAASSLSGPPVRIFARLH